LITINFVFPGVTITASGIGASPKPGTHREKCEGQADGCRYSACKEERRKKSNANDNQRYDPDDDDD